MATIHKLVELGDLEQIDGLLDDRALPQRYIYILPIALKNMEKLFGQDKDGARSSKLSLREQASELFDDFCAGKPLKFKYGVPGFNCLRCVADGIWELKHADLRFFGWFYCRDTFIISDAVHVSVVKSSKGYYTGYANQGGFRREALDLNPPKFVNGEDPENVLSCFTCP